MDPSHCSYKSRLGKQTSDFRIELRVEARDHTTRPLRANERERYFKRYPVTRMRGRPIAQKCNLSGASDATDVYDINVGEACIHCGHPEVEEYANRV